MTSHRSLVVCGTPQAGAQTRDHTDVGKRKNSLGSQPRQKARCRSEVLLEEEIKDRRRVVNWICHKLPLCWFL
jgi:hypothetical protein